MKQSSETHAHIIIKLEPFNVLSFHYSDKRREMGKRAESASYSSQKVTYDAEVCNKISVTKKK